MSPDLLDLLDADELYDLGSRTVVRFVPSADEDTDHADGCGNA